MIKTVVREHHWAPEIIGALSISGDDDYNSIEYWYSDIQEMHKDLTKKKK